jgi:hypothetical protein
MMVPDDGKGAFHIAVLTVAVPKISSPFLPIPFYSFIFTSKQKTDENHYFGSVEILFPVIRFLLLAVWRGTLLFCRRFQQSRKTG